jgi:DNA-3-methyladenine glycosylase II
MLDVAPSGEGILERDKQIATDTLDRLLGLSMDLNRFYEFAAGDRKLAQLADRFRGVKPPRFPSVFETLIRRLIMVAPSA